MRVTAVVVREVESTSGQPNVDGWSAVDGGAETNREENGGASGSREVGVSRWSEVGVEKAVERAESSRSAEFGEVEEEARR